MAVLCVLAEPPQGLRISADLVPQGRDELCHWSVTDVWSPVFVWLLVLDVIRDGKQVQDYKGRVNEKLNGPVCYNRCTDSTANGAQRSVESLGSIYDHDNNGLTTFPVVLVLLGTK